MEKFAILLLWFIPFIFSLSFHEAAHAWMARRCGDRTAEMMGRLTLNPMAHIDPIGTIIFPLIAFFTGLPLIGWAKPVPVNERNFRNWQKDGLLVAAAGPGSNFLLAIGFTALLFLLNRFDGGQAAFHAGFAVQAPLKEMARMGVLFNLILGLFNLIPIPPLDGGRVAAGLFPKFGRQLAMIERWGFIALYILFFTGIFGYIVFLPAKIMAIILFRIAA